MYDPVRNAALKANFRKIDHAQRAAIEGSLRRNYFQRRCPQDYLSTDWGKDDLANHLSRRLETDREMIIPWLDQAKTLQNSSILEIGCGTGASTVALAEQGANVVAIDIDEFSLSVAAERCRAYDLEVKFVHANAIEARKLLSNNDFEYIIFYAALEHMTHAERLTAMRETWRMLSPGNLWCVVETPNRLWFYDQHTSLLPFHMWLPDELAFEYSRFSSRQNYREIYRDYTDESKMHFLRRGRGVSFHEFELAMKPAGQLKVKSSLKMRDGYRGFTGRMRWRRSDASKYISLIRKMAPEVDEAFFQNSLNLILEKD